MMSDKTEYNKSYQLTNKEKITEQRKGYRLANKEQIAELARLRYAENKEKFKEKSKTYYAANRDKVLERCVAYKHKASYGITLDECISKFGTSCNNCGHTPGEDGTFLRTDHDHETGVVRGRLCHSCNVGIGMLGDTIEGLESAIRYLQRSELRCQ